jgi:hypothetical protein
MVHPGKLLRLLIACLAAAGCTGCSKGGSSYERYVPSEAVARAALDTALSAWQNGLPAGEMDGGAVKIQVVDSFRRAGQILRSYEVLGEVKGKDGPRCFAVRLELDNPREEQKLRYYAMGIDPIWVMRQEEYDMMLHWCPPPKKQSDADQTVRK